MTTKNEEIIEKILKDENLEKALDILLKDTTLNKCPEDRFKQLFKILIEQGFEAGKQEATKEKDKEFLEFLNKIDRKYCFEVLLEEKIIELKNSIQSQLVNPNCIDKPLEQSNTIGRVSSSAPKEDICRCGHSHKNMKLGIFDVECPDCNCEKFKSKGEGKK